MRFWAIVCIAWMGCCLGALASPAHVAYVSDVRGHAAVQQADGSWSDLPMLARLPDGARLRVAEQATLALTFGRVRVYLRGPAAVTVRPDGPRVAPLPSGEAGATFKALAVSRRKHLSIPKPLFVPQPGLRFASFHRVDTTQPTLRWISDVPLQGLELAIARSGEPPASVARGPVPASVTAYDVPSDTLHYGSEYRVSLLGIARDGATVQRADFLVVLPRDVAQRLTQRRQEAFAELSESPTDASPLVDLLDAYVEERVYDRALDLIDRLVAMRKDAAACKTLYLRKIQILTERGLGDQAQRVYEEFKRALDAD